MKEATGELNMSVVVVLIVAALSTFFFSVVWPRIRTSFRHNTNCDEAICECPVPKKDGKCEYTGSDLVECHAKNDPNKKIMCTWKG